MKKILLISEVYKKGGAGNATSHLLEFLRENTFDARLLSPYQKEKKNYIYSYYNSLTIFSYYFFKFLLRILSFFISNNKFYFFNNIFQISFFSSKKIKTISMAFMLVPWPCNVSNILKQNYFRFFLLNYSCNIPK